MKERFREAITSRHLVLTLDGWAVVAALLAALLVRTGVLKHVPW
jgi:hypothetical protein